MPVARRAVVASTLSAKVSKPTRTRARRRILDHFDNGSGTTRWP